MNIYHTKSNALTMCDLEKITTIANAEINAIVVIIQKLAPIKENNR